ncbi:UDP-galactose translocator [Aphelenchoides fujianensis]|nr:UDP-galactose translocator [Aphelenchoides fujianensis]
MSTDKQPLLLLDEPPVGGGTVALTMSAGKDGKELPIPMTVEIRREHTTGSAMKIGVLIWLTLQNSVHTLLIRYSRARAVDEMFHSSVAVFSMELVKMVICVYMVFNESFGFMGGVRILKKQVLDSPWDTLKVCIPAMLYTFQNNLFYVAASHLDAATFMIVSQLKLFTTAIFSILLLDRRLTRSQWISLGVLSVGVVLVQMQQSGGEQKNADGSTMNPFIGFTAACTACTISGFAGVFFEKILKGSAPVSLWMRNVQMGMFSIPASFVGALLTDGAAIREHGFYFGFDRIVWLTVVWYGIGGLSVAVCIKYADNIAKNFATSVAIILATIGSVFIFNFQPNVLFVLGAALVILSIFLYSSAGMFVMKVRPASKV